MELLSSQGVYSKHFTLRPLWRPTTVPQVSDFTWFDPMYRVSAHALTSPPAPVPDLPQPVHPWAGRPWRRATPPASPLPPVPTRPLSPPPLPRLPGPAEQESLPNPHSGSPHPSTAPTPSLCSQDGVARLVPPSRCGSLSPPCCVPLPRLLGGGGRWSRCGRWSRWRWSVMA